MIKGFINDAAYEKYLYRLDIIKEKILKCKDYADSKMLWVHNFIVYDVCCRLEEVRNSSREMMGYLECLWDFDFITDQTWTDLTEFYLFLYLECENYIDSLCLGDEVEL